MCSKYLQNKCKFLHKQKEKRHKSLGLSNFQTDNNVNSIKVDLHENLDDTMNDILSKENIEAEYVQIDDIIDADELGTELITVDIVEPESDPPVHFSEKNKIVPTEAGGKRDFKCVVCGKTFFSLINLEMHYRFIEHGHSEDGIDSQADNSLGRGINDKHSGSLTKVSCQICDKTFPYEKMLIQHCETQHSLKKSKIQPYQCELCPKQLTTSSSFKRHLLYHEGIKHFTCTFCGKGFIVNQDLGEHEKIHLNEKKYRCEKCNKSFNTFSNLQTHNFFIHADPSEWKHLCNFCPKRFPMKATLNEHLKRHLGIKEYQCLSCGLWFTTKYCLGRHMFIHIKEKTYKCKWCPNRSFRDRKRMRTHMSMSHAMVMR